MELVVFSNRNFGSFKVMYLRNVFDLSVPHISRRRTINDMTVGFSFGLIFPPCFPSPYPSLATSSSGPAIDFWHSPSPSGPSTHCHDQRRHCLDDRNGVLACRALSLANRCWRLECYAEI